MYIKVRKFANKYQMQTREILFRGASEIGFAKF